MFLSGIHFTTLYAAAAKCFICKVYNKTNRGHAGVTRSLISSNMKEAIKPRPETLSNQDI